MTEKNSLEYLIGELLEEEAILEVRNQLESGVDPSDILKACQDGIKIVGDRFSSGAYYISDLMMSGEIFKRINEMVLPKLEGRPTTSKGKVVFGTVKGDIHNIGKDLVVGFLRSYGYEVTDVGIDTPVEVFVDAVRKTGAPVVGLSGLLTVAFDGMKETIEALSRAGLTSNPKVMIGGGTINDDVCKYTGADAWGDSPHAALNLCKEWIK
jgi:methanogenic corrinoid protein MtbC1